MSRKDFSNRIKETIEGDVPQNAFGEEDQEQATSRLAIQGTKSLKGARSIPLDKIHPDPGQPRKILPEDSINEMADTIKAHERIFIKLSQGRGDFAPVKLLD
jgi:hypothetical protein